MTENYYKIQAYQSDPATFSGLISFSDFNTNYPNGHIADRIAADLKFNEWLKRTAIRKTKEENNYEWKAYIHKKF